MPKITTPADTDRHNRVVIIARLICHLKRFVPMDKTSNVKLCHYNRRFNSSREMNRQYIDDVFLQRRKYLMSAMMVHLLRRVEPSKVL